MALQTSGPISFADLQAEFGGSHPIGLNEYYRGGAYVPAQITEQTSSNITYWVSPVRSSGPYTNAWITIDATNAGGTKQINIYKNGSAVVVGYTPSNALTRTTYYSGGSYIRESLAASYVLADFSEKRLYAFRNVNYYNTTVTVNTDVPSSGAISLNQFYGARKS